MGAGLLFAFLWASASTATKIGLAKVQPLILAEFRFLLASLILLVAAHAVLKLRLPKGKEWKQIALYGFLNIAVYLGCYVIAMQEVTAGVGSLAISISPVFISFFSVIFLKHKLSLKVIIALLLGVIGVFMASVPLFAGATVTASGLLLLLFSMLAYSVAGVYFSAKEWGNLSLITINGWQTLFGGIFLLPVTFYFYQPQANNYTYQFLLATSWLAIPVSIFAMLLWLKLLKWDPVKAGLWLFLCPIFGYLIASLVLEEPITKFTFIGVGFVLAALLLAQKNSFLQNLKNKLFQKSKI